VHPSATLTKKLPFSSATCLLIDIDAHGQLLQKFHVTQCKSAWTRTGTSLVAKNTFFSSSPALRSAPLYGSYDRAFDGCIWSDLFITPTGNTGIPPRTERCSIISFPRLQSGPVIWDE